jgi:glutathione S-transferase
MTSPEQPPVATTSSIGELWYLQGSPWSIRVHWTLALCAVDAEKRPYKPFIDQFALWRRLGFPLRGQTLSVPVLFPAAPRGARPLRSSYDISKYAAQQAGGDHVRRLFPPDREGDVQRLVKAADCVMEFGRGRVNTYMKANPDEAVRNFLPPNVQGLFFAKPVVRFSLWLFGRKYPPSSRADVSAALTDIQSTLRMNGTGYLIGSSLTFADICVACAIFFGMDFGRNIPESATLAQEFPDIVEWRKRIFAEHFRGNETEAFDFNPPPAKKNK